MNLIHELNKQDTVILSPMEEEAMKVLLYDMGVLLLGKDAKRMRNETDKQYVERIKTQFQRISKRLKIGLTGAGITALVVGLALYNEAVDLDSFKSTFKATKVWLRNLLNFSAGTPHRLGRRLGLHRYLQPPPMPPKKSYFDEMGNWIGDMGNAVGNAVGTFMI
jgi:hypothetical protein